MWRRARAPSHALPFDCAPSPPRRQVAAVGHRVVHGLDIAKAVLLDGAAVGKIKQAGGGATGRRQAVGRGLAVRQAGRRMASAQGSTRPSGRATQACTGAEAA